MAGAGPDRSETGVRAAVLSKEWRGRQEKEKIGKEKSGEKRGRSWRTVPYD